MFILILINSVVVLNASLLLRYAFYFESVSDYLIAFFIIFFSQIVLSLELLGILKVLNLNNVIILEVCILVLVYIFIKIRKLKPKDNLRAKFNLKISKPNLNRLQLLALSVIIGFALVKIAINLVNPPFGWDDLNYHFTFPVEWLKHGNLENPISISGDPSVSYYPINGSLFFLWFILPLKNVFLADLGQIPFFILAFLAVYSLAKKLSLSKEYVFFAAAIFTLVPNYFKQMEIAYVDVMVGALFLVSMNYLFLLHKDSSLKNIAIYSLSLGLAIGTKITALPLSILFFIPFLYSCFNKKDLKKSILIFLVGISFILFVGGYGYIRNLMETGNPLYPLNLKLFNKIIFKGVADIQMYRTAIRPGDFSLSKILFSEGLGVQTTLFLLPALFLGLPIAILKRRKELNFNLIYFLILPILIILVFRFIIPLANLRYIYACLGIGFIIAFYIIQALNLPRLLIKILVLLCILGSIAELAGHLELITSLLLSLGLFFTLPYLREFLRTKKTFKSVVVILITLFLLLVFLEKDYIRNEFVRYVKMVEYSGFWPDATKAWGWLNQNTQGENIAYIGRPVLFPLYGTNFKNNVYYVSVNKVEPAKLHYFPKSRYVWGWDGDRIFRNFEDEFNYRGKADYNIWLKNLSKRNIDYLFVYSEILGKDMQFPLEDKWAGNNAERFIRVFKNDTIHIYKILR